MEHPRAPAWVRALGAVFDLVDRLSGRAGTVPPQESGSAPGTDTGMIRESNPLPPFGAGPAPTTESLLDALRRFDAETGAEDYAYRRYRRPIPLEAEEALSHAMPAVEAFDEAAWAAVRALGHRQLPAKLLAYGYRMATLATRTKEEMYIYCGAMAQVLAHDEQGYSFHAAFYGVAGVLYDAGRRIGADPDSIFRRAARFGPPDEPKVFLRLAAWKEYLKPAEYRGIKTVPTAAGVYYGSSPDAAANATLPSDAGWPQAPAAPAPDEAVGSFIDTLGRLAATLSGQKLDSGFYGSSVPLPLPVEEELAKAMPVVESFNERAWQAVRASVDEQLDYVLWTYAHRMASLATRTGDRRHLYAAAMSMMLGGSEFDFRDLYLLCGRLCDAAERVGADPIALLSRASRIGTRARAWPFMDVLARDEPGKAYPPTPWPAREGGVLY